MSQRPLRPGPFPGLSQTLLGALAFLSPRGSAAQQQPQPSQPHRPCDPSTFSFPTIFGASPIFITAAPVHGFVATTGWGAPEASGPALPASGISFCNVTVTYTHPGQGDEVNTYVWVPLERGSSGGSNSSSTSNTSTPWNGRLVGVGGGGLATGGPDGELMALYVHQGFAAATTDGGHRSPDATNGEWVLASPGNVAWPRLVNFAYLSLHELSIIGKAITAQYFAGKQAERSYWVGCSMGGRQGVMLAQRYPDDFDGILAGCPVLNGPSIGVALHWGQMVMNRLGVYPSPCQMAAVAAAAVEACDELDGQKDGIVAEWERCSFDPRSIVGQTVNCTSLGFSSGVGVRPSDTVTTEAAVVAQAIWQGAKHDDGERLWYGFPVGTDLTGPIATGSTQCTDNGVCVGQSQPLTVSWLRYFWKKDPTFDLATLTIDQYRDAMRQSNDEFEGMLGTNSTDLSAFRRAGGKMLSWHGVNDQLIQMAGTRAYYRGVLEKDAHAGDYYRHFEVPGALHCAARPGAPYPILAFDTLRRWVEGGTPPDFLAANILGASGPTEKLRKVCAYPAQTVFIGGDPGDLSSYSCIPPGSCGGNRTIQG